MSGAEAERRALVAGRAPATAAQEYTNECVGEPPAAENFHRGITIRDYFAAQAMQAIVGSQKVQSGSGSFASIASVAYTQADAMLLERAK